MRSRYIPWYTPTRSTEVSVLEGRITLPICSGSNSARAGAARTASSTEPGWTMTACIHRWSRESGSSRGRGGNGLLLFPVGLRLERLGVHDLELGNVRVPLEQGRDVPGPRHGVAVEVPDRVDHVVVVRVDDVGALVG